MYRDSKQVAELVTEVNESFEGFEGLISRTIFSDVENDLASTQYIYEDRKTALKAQKRVQELMEKYEEVIGFSSEFIFKVIQTTILNKY